ncbi:MAG: hypothetical protein IT385_08860 [Deltaproteobacteria bacterium]|nr:hypothetical protein [Deltaproteobacteria bacterium]
MPVHLTRLGTLARVIVEGRHRARFLHAMTTAEVGKLVPGDATFALVATANGRHVGQLRLEVEAQALQLVCDAGALAPIVDTLKKHKVADDVRFGAPVEGEATLALVLDAAVEGETWPTWLADRLGPLPAPGRFEARDGLRVTAWDAARSELGRPTLHVRGPASDVDALAAALTDASALPLDVAAYEAARIASGWPRDGVDLGPDDLALASERLLATVSWTKGCFLGQEVFVMARDRGEVPKRLVGLHLEPGSDGAAACPAPGAALTTDDGKGAGVLGSSAGADALAVLKRRAAVPGQVVRLPDGRACAVVPLPLPRHAHGLRAVAETA